MRQSWLSEAERTSCHRAEGEGTLHKRTRGLSDPTEIGGQTYKPRVSLTTFSIAAYCQRTGELGIAVSTAIPAVGAINPFAKARVGAIATQAWSNPYLGIDGLDLLEQGLSPIEVLEQLLKVDADRERRQLSIVDAHGNVAAFTGREVEPICGHYEGKGYVVAGNLLINQETIRAMADAFERTPGPLAERLLVALEAGQAIGGDRRGKVSAALLVVKDEEYPCVDLRVDEHKRPVAELRRIFNIYKALPYLDDLHPRRAWPKGTRLGAGDRCHSVPSTSSRSRPRI